ncbi:hypothetical protein AYI69_g5840 [Smittium culicis]|uniref:Uncharacterized protein n=1 Tax=Smittium culicis TaxID=133412 RepID=A0A1R1Y3D4_9FUNG|nr:hypothetical protein AYI69_g5840 [Smittium culicis]
MGGFIKDSNGTGKNQKACFRCGECKDRYSIIELYSSILKGSEDNFTVETGLDSILLPPSPRKEVDPAQPIYVDVNSKVIPGDDIGLAVIYPSVSVGVPNTRDDSSDPSVNQMDTAVDHSELEEPGDLVVSDSELLLDMETEAAMRKQRAPVDFPSHDSASYLKTATVGDFTPIKNAGIVINDQSIITPAPLANSLMDFSLGSTISTNKRTASPPARASKRQNLNTSIYVTNDAFSHRMDLHLNDVKEHIKKNRAIDLARLEKLESENKFLREKLDIQTKRIDRLTQKSKTPVLHHKLKNNTANSVPAPDISSTQPISFNFGTSAQPVGLPLNEPANKKLSYSEISKSQAKNSKEFRSLHRVFVSW